MSYALNTLLGRFQEVFRRSLPFKRCADSVGTVCQKHGIGGLIIAKIGLIVEKYA